MPSLGGSLTGKYRKLLIAHHDLVTEASAMQPALRHLENLHRAAKLTDAEFTAFFVLLFAARRAYGEAWRDNTRAIKLNQVLGWIHSESKPVTDTLPATLSKLQLPGMPGMIFSVLANWLTGEINLKLVSYPTSAAEMLASQAEGWRYITIDLEAAMRGETIEQKRDAFEFALHDLGHAWAFFKHEYNPVGQVQFFSVLLHDIEKLTPLASADEKFAADLEYCMSDMNSHPEHLRQYLRGVIIEAYYRQRKLGRTEEYSEVAFEKILVSLNVLEGERTTPPFGHPSSLRRGEDCAED